MVRKIDEHEDYWFYLIDLLDSEEDRILMTQFSEINDDEQILNIGPILNDDILEIGDDILIDPFEPRDYCNYTLKQSYYFNG